MLSDIFNFQFYEIFLLCFLLFYHCKVTYVLGPRLLNIRFFFSYGLIRSKVSEVLRFYACSSDPQYVLLASFTVVTLMTKL